MSFYFVKTPYWIKFIFSKQYWSFSKTKKTIYLSFDDGPTPKVTLFVLQQLKKYNAKATFFCIGKNVKNYPKIVTAIRKEKHTIGNHTHNHLNGWKTPTKTYINNAVMAQNTINSISTKSKKIFRPPYGKIKPKQVTALQKLGYKIIMWDVLSADFDTISKEKCLQNVLQNTTNGSVIVFHDSKKAEENLKYVLPRVLEFFSKKGFKFKEI